MPPPVPVLLADRYAGVRVALRELLEAAGVARVVAEAGSLAGLRAAIAARPDATVIAGLTYPDGDVAALLPTARVIVCTWLPADEHGLDLSAATAVVGPPLIPGLIRALRELHVA